MKLMPVLQVSGSKRGQPGAPRAASADPPAGHKNRLPLRFPVFAVAWRPGIVYNAASVVGVIPFVRA